MKDLETRSFVDNRTEAEIRREAARMTAENYLRIASRPYRCEHLYPYLDGNPLLAWFVSTQERRGD